MEVNENNYLKRLVEHSLIKVYARLIAEDRDQIWSDESDFMLSKPKLDIDVDGKVLLNELTKLKVTFTNPLAVTLRHCRFAVAGHVQSESFDFRDVKPGEQVTADLSVTVEKANYVHKTVTFRSDQLQDIYGTVELQLS